VGVLLDAGIASVAVAAGGVVIRWSRRRCDEALAAARRMARPEQRSFALVAKPRRGPLPRAQARQLRAFQQALDDEGWGGVALARRAAPSASTSSEADWAEGDPA
jgi:hypothetical protein